MALPPRTHTSEVSPFFHHIGLLFLRLVILPRPLTLMQGSPQKECDAKRTGNKTCQTLALSIALNDNAVDSSTFYSRSCI